MTVRVYISKTKFNISRAGVDASGNPPLSDLHMSLKARTAQILDQGFAILNSSGSASIDFGPFPSIPDLYYQLVIGDGTMRLPPFIYSDIEKQFIQYSVSNVSVSTSGANFQFPRLGVTVRGDSFPNPYGVSWLLVRRASTT